MQGTYREGHVQLDQPVSWPEGLRVEISPLVAGGQVSHDEDRWGIDDDLPDTPVNRAEIVRRMDAVVPLDMTPEQQSEWQAMLQWFDDHSRQAVKREMGLAP